MPGRTAFVITLNSPGNSGSAAAPLQDTLSKVIISNDARWSRSNPCWSCNAVAGYLKTVIHGRVGGEGSESFPATLIVASFRFMPSPDSRRFRQGDIRFLLEGELDEIGIHIAPEGYIALYPDDYGNEGYLVGETCNEP